MLFLIYVLNLQALGELIITIFDVLSRFYVSVCGNFVDGVWYVISPTLPSLYARIVDIHTCRPIQWSIQWSMPYINLYTSHTN